MQLTKLKGLALAVSAGAVLSLSGAAKAQAPSSDPVKAQQDQLTKGAQGYQDGQVQKLEGNTLQLKPYQKKAGVATLSATADTKVFAFEPNGLVSGGMSAAVLSPGANVRVYYKSSSEGKAPEIVAIQLLPFMQAVQDQASQANK